ncbi:MAG: hypothetical protein AB7T49_08720 [Oligoflexales bacterium]
MQRGVNQTLAWIIAVLLSGGIIAGVVFAVIKFTPRELNFEDTSVLRLDDVPAEGAGHDEKDAHGEASHGEEGHGEASHGKDDHAKNDHEEGKHEEEKGSHGEEGSSHESGEEGSHEKEADHNSHESEH